jgi:hypothetical protein
MSSAIKRNEWVWVLALSILILALSTIPYLAGVTAPSADQEFSGAVFDRQDYAVHLATMHLGANGEWAYRLRFTSEPHQAAHVKMFYIFLGHIARLIGLGIPLTYHLGRWIFGILACAAIYTLMAHLIEDLYWRRLAFLLAVMGSGLGWLQLLFGWIPIKDISPIDFWLIDASIFFGFQIFPHFAAITALLAGTLVFFYRFLDSRRWRWWLLIALLGLVTQAVQPYAVILTDFALLGIVLGKWWRERRFPKEASLAVVGLGLMQVPLTIYNLYVFQSDPVWRGFAAQNITLSPPPIYYLWGFGLFWPLVAIGILQILREKDPPKLGFLAWMGGAFICAYLPTSLQRRFMHAMTIPLTVVAISGLKDSLLPWLARLRWANFWLRPKTAALLYIGLASLSSISLSLGTAIFMRLLPEDRFDPNYLVAAVDWLSTHADRNDFVISGEQTGQLVAARSGLPVYLGHPMETIDYPQKTQQVAALFSPSTVPEPWDLSCCEWVIYGPYERTSEEERFAFPNYREVFSNGEVTIYQRVP